MGKRWWSVIPTHVHYFTRASLSALLVRHGYRVVSISTQPKTFTAGYYLGRLGGYSDGAGARAWSVPRRRSASPTGSGRRTSATACW